MVLNQATGRDIFTTHGREGIVPFMKGFLPLLGKYKGRGTLAHSEKWSQTRKFQPCNYERDFANFFFLKALDSAADCLNSLLHSIKVVTHETLHFGPVKVNILSFTLNMFAHLI